MYGMLTDIRLTDRQLSLGTA